VSKHTANVLQAICRVLTHGKLSAGCLPWPGARQTGGTRQRATDLSIGTVGLLPPTHTPASPSSIPTAAAAACRACHRPALLILPPPLPQRPSSLASAATRLLRVLAGRDGRSGRPELAHPRPLRAAASRRAPAAPPSAAGRLPLHRPPPGWPYSAAPLHWPGSSAAAPATISTTAGKRLG
jgi:hypothetical protein